MNIILTPKAEKQLEHLSKMDQLAVARKIRSFSSSKTIPDSKKLKKEKNAYRARVRDIRIVYTKSRKTIYIVLIGHRKDIYKVVNRLLK